MLAAPKKILLHKKSKILELHFDSGFGNQNQSQDLQSFFLPAEYLRVYSPSAEVKGHGPNQEVLQVGKQFVGIERIEPQGNYAIKIIFDDEHDSGIYSWEYLYDLGINQDNHWQDYLQRLDSAGKTRDPSEGVVKIIQP